MNTKPNDDNEDDLSVYEASTPKLIRLTTGEDLVAELTEVSDDEDDSVYYYIHNPIKLVYVPSPNPSIFGVAMSQWISHTICEEQIFTINGDTIVTVSNVSDYISQMYYKAISHYNDHPVPPGHENDDDDLEHALEEMESMSMSDIDHGRRRPSKSKKKIIH